MRHPEEGNYILREIHEEACGSHQGTRTLAGKTLRAGYKSAHSVSYTTTYHDEPLRTWRPSCPSCHLISGEWTYLAGPFPPIVAQKKFLLVVVRQFIWQNIITRFNIPRILISDNDRQFDSGPTREYFSQFGIQKRFTSVARPQANGQAEAANKIILVGIKPQLEGAKGSWVDELPGVLWSAWITTKEDTSHTPFSLVYSSEAVLLVEVRIPSPRMTFYEYETNEEQRKVDLELLPEARADALLKSITYKQRITRYFDKRVAPRPIQEVDWSSGNLKQLERDPQKENSHLTGKDHIK